MKGCGHEPENVGSQKLEVANSRFPPMEQKGGRPCAYLDFDFLTYTTVIE